MLLTWDQDTTPERRLAEYERKKAALRARTAGWPPLPPDDMDALPEPARGLWVHLVTLRREHHRQCFGLGLMTLHPYQRRAMLQLKQAVVNPEVRVQDRNVVPIAKQR
jgi:hypothetical protein